MRTMDLATAGEAAAVSDQAGDAGPDRRDFLNELLDRFDLIDGPTAAGPAERHLGMLVIARRQGAIAADMPLGPARLFLLAVGDLFRLATPERAAWRAARRRASSS